MQTTRLTLTGRQVGLFVFALALATRAGWGIYRMSRAEGIGLEFPDEEQYWVMADSLLKGEGLRDELGFRAGRMPLYPGLLAVAASLPSGTVIARAAQWLIGAFGAVLAMRLGARVAGARAGVIVGLLFAFDPFLIFFSSLLLTETLFVTLLVALWATAAPFVIERRAPRSAEWAGVVLLSIACVYARESTLGLIGLAAIAYLAWRRFDKPARRGIMLLALGVGLGLAPWAVRNRLVLGQWRWLTTRGGISLYDGVRPGATGAGDLGDVKQSDAVRGLSEVEWDDYFRRESIRRLREDPARIGDLAVRKFMRMWNPVPNVEAYQSRAIRMVSAAWMTPLMALAIAGAYLLARLPRPKDTPAGPRARACAPWPCGQGAAVALFLLLPAAYLTALHMVFVGSVRYRLGAMPMLMVLAAVALARGLERIGATRRGEGHA